MLVITGALKESQLGVGVDTVSLLTRVLAPAASLVETAAWSATWGFHETPVDGDSILPALAAVAELELPEPLVLAFGVLTPWGEYVPLSFRSRSLAASVTEADANAADVRSRYKGGDRPGLYDDLDDLLWWELVTQ